MAGSPGARWRRVKFKTTIPTITGTAWMARRRMYQTRDWEFKGNEKKV